MVQLVKYGNCSIRVAFKSSCITSCLWWLLPCDPSVMLYCRCDVLFLMWWMLCQQCGRRSSSTCFLEPVWCTRCWSNRTGELLVWRVSHWCHRINPSITLWPSQSELCRVVRTAVDVEGGRGARLTSVSGVWLGHLTCCCDTMEYICSDVSMLHPF